MKRGFCIDCRTLLGENERACDGGKDHKVIQWPDERNKLLKEIWGRESLHRMKGRLAKSGAAGAGTGSIIDGCGSGCSGVDACDISSGGCNAVEGAGEFFLAILVIVILAAAFVLLGWLLLQLWRFIRQKINDSRPLGAIAAPKRPKGKMVRGRVLSSKPVAAQCLVFNERQVAGGLPVMLIDATSFGFDIALEDGRRVRIPEGRVRLDAPESKLGTTQARAHLHSIDPDLPSDAPLHQNPFVFDDATCAMLKNEQTVYIVDDLEMAPDAGSGYRENAHVYVPRGVAHLVRPDE